jgi:hypothetical protein
MLSFLALLAWLMAEHPFSVRVEADGPPPSCLQMAHRSGPSMPENKNPELV